MEGVVLVEFKILKDSTIEFVNIKESTHKILSRAAKKTIVELSGLLPKPKENMIITIPIRYKLN